MSDYVIERSRDESQAIYDLMVAGNMKHTPKQTYTVADRLEEKAAQHPDKVFLIDVHSDARITFSAVNQAANQIARAINQQGLGVGDVAALVIENRFEFFIYWFGLAKAGVTVALLNTSVSGKALQHAVEVSNAKLFLLGDECLHLLDTLAEPLSVPVFRIPDQQTQLDHAPEGIESFYELSKNEPSDNLPATVRTGLTGESFVFYIFTSGTTGLPKAARITHMKWIGVGEGMIPLMDVKPDDIFYCVLPLYHGAAGMSLTSTALCSGSTIVLRRRFSVSKFWQEVRQYNVNTCQYIGEICRYLFNQPQQPNDRDNPLKRIMGAGMGTDIWQRFQQRFDIPHIYEGWSATEANTSLINLENKVGSCGRQPFKDKHNARLVKFDIENEVPVRDENGLMIECGVGEVGEMVAMIMHFEDLAAGRFDGYTQEQATQKKIYHNVFQTGDQWWSSGDLLKCDADGYFYFVDRVGDTFRWKSENVSTMEVAEALGDFDGMEVINVYGVKVPGQEGRAGMVSIVMQPDQVFDSKAFYQLAKQQLPKYAMPLFVRLSNQADMTATFKLRKVDLQKQGYNPDNFPDPLYVLSDRQTDYIPYSADALEALGVEPFG